MGLMKPGHCSESLPSLPLSIVPRKLFFFPLSPLLPLSGKFGEMIIMKLSLSRLAQNGVDFCALVCFCVVERASSEDFNNECARGDGRVVREFLKRILVERGLDDFCGLSVRRTLRTTLLYIYV